MFPPLLTVLNKDDSTTPCSIIALEDSEYKGEHPNPALNPKP